jgi:N6-L-threonylcarbamoyladenine synthase
MIILAIETSCDDTCAAILENDRVLANVISSQTDLHKEWGGVVPDIAKRAHQARIKAVIATAIKRSKITNNQKTISKQASITKKQFPNNDIRIEEIIDMGMKKIDVIAVTKGPGLAIALSVGVNTAKELALKYNKKLVAVNHIEGHLLSNFVKNSKGLPERKMDLPALALTVSGGHTKIILINQNNQFPISNNKFPNKFQKTISKIKKSKLKFNYEVVGETLDDAAGEALDKAAKLLGLGYPGGPVIEKLALLSDKQNRNKEQTHGSVPTLLKLPSPLADKKILDYSFSGLKTSFYYQIKDWPKEKVWENINILADEFQNSVFETLIRKYKLAIIKFEPKLLIASGGVLQTWN